MCLAEEKKLNIYQKLAKIRKQVEVVQKNKAGYGYRYVTDDELLSKITGSMDRLGVSLIPSVVPNTLVVTPYTYQKTKAGKQETVNEIIVQSDLVFEWVNDECPAEKIVVNWAMVGQQADASQSFGSGLTYVYRYFLLKYFGVSTVEDDPDNWRAKQREAEEAENKAITTGILAEADRAIKEFVAANPDRRSEVTKFVSGYVKSGNYMQIKEAALAANLLEEFNKQFGKGE